jgi:hypothetical protein
MERSPFYSGGATAGQEFGAYLVARYSRKMLPTIDAGYRLKPRSVLYDA